MAQNHRNLQCVRRRVRAPLPLSDGGARNRPAKTAEPGHGRVLLLAALPRSEPPRALGRQRRSATPARRSFEVELASQVLFTGGRRHYACSPACRAANPGRRAHDPRSASCCTPIAQVGDEPGPAHVAEPIFDTVPAPAPFERRAARRCSTRRERRCRRRRARRWSSSAAAAPARDATPRRCSRSSITRAAPARPRRRSARRRARARGQRVLLVDTDAQGNVAVSLGAEGASARSTTCS